MFNALLMEKELNSIEPLIPPEIKVTSFLPLLKINWIFCAFLWEACQKQKHVNMQSAMAWRWLTSRTARISALCPMDPMLAFWKSCAPGPWKRGTSSMWTAVFWDATRASLPIRWVNERVLALAAEILFM